MSLTPTPSRAARFPQLFLGLVVLSAGLAFGSSAVRDGLKARSGQEVITVTGSARRTITSDTVVWRASLTSTQPTPAEASRELAAWVGRVQSFLRGAGAADDEVRVNPISTETIAQVAPDGHSDTGKIAGYKLARAFEVRSSRVREITAIVPSLPHSKPAYRGRHGLGLLPSASAVRRGVLFARDGVGAESSAR